MKVKLLTLVELYPSLQRLCGAPLLPARTGFKFAKLLKNVKENFDGWIEQRDRIFTEVGATVEGNEYKFADDASRKKAIEQADELLKEEISIDFEPVEIEKLGEITLPAVDLMMLEDFIK